MKVTALGILFGILAAMFVGNARAQEHHGHPPQDMEIHRQFYSTWFMPDNPSASCCNEQDCSPAESKFENGRWMARKVGETGAFTPIPPQKIERNRDSPDGRSHLCGRGLLGGFYVFCYINGAGS